MLDDGITDISIDVGVGIRVNIADISISIGVGVGVGVGRCWLLLSLSFYRTILLDFLVMVMVGNCAGWFC